MRKWGGDMRKQWKIFNNVGGFFLGCGLEWGGGGGYCK